MSIDFEIGPEEDERTDGVKRGGLTLSGGQFASANLLSFVDSWHILRDTLRGSEGQD